MAGSKKKSKRGKLLGNFLINKILGGSLDHYGNEISDVHGIVSGGLFKKFFDKIAIEPEKVEKLRYFAERGRLIYALPRRSPLDFFFLNIRLRFSGVPVPEIAYNTPVYRFQPLRKVFKVGLSRFLQLINFGRFSDPYLNKYYLKRYRDGAGFVLNLEDPASFTARLINPTRDPIYHLVKLYRKHGETVIIVPIFPVFGKSPTRAKRRLWDIFIGPKDRPGRLRKIVHYIHYYNEAFIEVGDPVTIDRFLARKDQEGLTDERIAFNIRKELWDHSQREQKVIRGPELRPRTQIMESVLRDPEILRVMRQEAKKRDKPFRSIRKEAAKYMDEIAANYSHTTIEFLDWALAWVWNNLFDGVHVDEKGLARLKEAAKRYPVIYVPSHKSHLDYLILSWVLYHANMVPPHIVAGVNLDTWPIGFIFRTAGAFFIRRSFRDNALYGAVFTKYVEVLIKGGYNIEFFIEGGRSRTGRLLIPTMGMVKYIIKAYEHEAAKDIMFVPLYIGYDQIFEEGEYLEEIRGVKNPKSNLFEMIRNANLITKRYGRIHIRFAEPISLRYHLECMSDRLEGKLEENEGLVITELAEDIIQGINRNQVVTPFSLMAAALLASPAKAISREELLNALALYFQYLADADAKFAVTLENFTKAMDDVIGYYRERKLIEIEGEDEADDSFEPIYTLPEEKRLSLNMYSNMILHHFLPMCFVTMSLLSADYGTCDEQKLKWDYGFLKDLFSFEFVQDERFTDKEKIERCVRFLQNGRLLEAFTEDGHGHYRVTSKGREEMVYFASMLTNFLEAYGVVLNASDILEKKAMTEKEFLAKLRRTGNRLYKQGQVLRREAISQLLFKNAIKFSINNGILTKVPNDGKPELLTKGGKESDDAKNQLLTHISKFIRVEKYHYLEK